MAPSVPSRALVNPIRAPKASNTRRSRLTPADMQSTTRYPLAAPSMASAMPVLPDVAWRTKEVAKRAVKLDFDHVFTATEEPGKAYPVRTPDDRAGFTSIHACPERRSVLMVPHEKAFLGRFSVQVHTGRELDSSGEEREPPGRQMLRRCGRRERSK